jgi:ABC-2 type transport system permease protein
MELNPNHDLEQSPTTDKYIVAALISGKLKADSIPMSDKEPAADEPAAKPEPAAAVEALPAEPAKPKEVDINVVLVSDIDCLTNVFFNIRAMGADKDAPVNWEFDNVTFVLNVLDDLAKDDRFIEIRKRRPQYRTLSKIDERTKEAVKAAQDAKKKFVTDMENAVKEEQKKFDDRIAQLKNRKNINPTQAISELSMAQQDGQRRLETRKDQLKREVDRKVKESEFTLAQQVRSTQDSFKLWSVLLPPIPPLIVAFFVYFNRREKEKTGVSKSRLRVK